MVQHREPLHASVLADNSELQRSRLSNGITLWCRLKAWAMVALLAAGGVALSMPAKAADVSYVHVAVSATVLRHLGIRLLTAPRTIEITATDIDRGFVDLPFAATLEIRSNNSSGYQLVIDSQADFSIGTEVRSLGDFAFLGRTGGVLNFPANGKGMQTTPVALSFRVLLSKEARPGSYLWPIQISVLPV